MMMEIGKLTTTCNKSPAARNINKMLLLRFLNRRHLANETRITEFASTAIVASTSSAVKAIAMKVASG